MDSKKCENQLNSGHDGSLKRTIHFQALRYLEAMLGFYLTRGDHPKTMRVRKIIIDLRSLYEEDS